MVKKVEIIDIVRKDVPIYYRRIFTATAILSLMGQRLQRRIEFTIETKPTGAKDVAVNLIETLDYPLIPILRELKEIINELDKTGALP
ncbi:hypothetical protein MASR2M78_04260 [Treponema sp.]